MALEGSIDRHTNFEVPNMKQTLKVADVRFYWIDDDMIDDRWYHWRVDCPWVSAGLWHGGRLVTSPTPPPEAEDERAVREFLLAHHPGPAWREDLFEAARNLEKPERRWLCRVCKDYVPRLVAAVPVAAEEPCGQCGCPHELHSQLSYFDRGCGMAWADGVRGLDGEILQVGMIHCPCDGYAPSKADPEAPSKESVEWATTST
jgi:hypothetical protein